MTPPDFLTTPSTPLKRICQKNQGPPLWISNYCASMPLLPAATCLTFSEKIQINLQKRLYVNKIDKLINKKETFLKQKEKQTTT
jgi:hypothetical protein